MKVFIDTNILISAMLNPDGLPAKAYFKAVTGDNEGIICDQNIYELRRVFNRKFPKKIQALESFLSVALLSLTVVKVPDCEYKNESLVRDVLDRPILRAANAAGADIIITGDKDFLESGITSPAIFTAAQFVELQ